MSKAQSYLAAVFLLALSLQLAGLLWVLARHDMRNATFLQLAGSLLPVYAVPLAAIAGGSLALKGVAARQRVPSGATFVGISLSVLWNAVLVVRVAIYVFSAEDVPGDAQAFVEMIGRDGAFLITGVLAYFFAKASN